MTPLVLPEFTATARGPKRPNNARTLVRRSFFNEHGTEVVVTVYANRPRTLYFASAHLPGPYGMRASNALTTRHAYEAGAWCAAVDAGQVVLDGERLLTALP